MSARVLAQSVLHLVNPSLYLYCSFLSFVFNLRLGVVLVGWWILECRNGFRLWLEVCELLFEFSDFLLNVFLLGHSVWISDRGLAFGVWCALLVVLSRGFALLSFQSVHDHGNKLLVIVQRGKVVNWREVLIHLCVFLEMEDTSVKGFVFGK